MLFIFRYEKMRFLLFLHLKSCKSRYVGAALSSAATFDGVDLGDVPRVGVSGRAPGLPTAHSSWPSA